MNSVLQLFGLSSSINEIHLENNIVSEEDDDDRDEMSKLTIDTETTQEKNVDTFGSESSSNSPSLKTPNFFKWDEVYPGINKTILHHQFNNHSKRNHFFNL